MYFVYIDLIDVKCLRTILNDFFHFVAKNNFMVVAGEALLCAQNESPAYLCTMRVCAYVYNIYIINIYWEYKKW